MLTAIIPCLLLMLAGNVGLIAGVSVSLRSAPAGRNASLARLFSQKARPHHDSDQADRRLKQAAILKIAGLGLIAAGALGANLVNLFGAR